MKRLILIRHGLTDWNENGRLMGRSDVALNVRGRAQASRVAEALASRPITAIYSSPQPRTRETAAPLASAMDRVVLIEPGVDEVWLSDAWKGKTVAELRGDEELEAIIEDPMERIDAIEPIAEVQARAVGACERFREHHPDADVAVVSHGDPLRVIIAHYLGLELGKFRRLACDNGSISEITFNRRGPRLETLNNTP